MRFLYMLFIMLMVSGGLYVFQEAGNDIVESENNNKSFDTIYIYKNGVVSQIVQNGSVKGFGKDDLPSSIQGGADSGNVGGFSDTFNTYLGYATGVGSFLLGLVTAVPNLLKDMGFPSYISNFLGLVWWGLAVTLFVSWLRWNI